MRAFFEIQGDAQDVLIHLTVTPGARKTQILGLHEGRLKLSVQSPPVEGAANKAVIIFLAKKLGIAKSRLTLVQGEKSHQKTLHLRTDKPEDFAVMLMGLETP